MTVLRTIVLISFAITLVFTTVMVLGEYTDVLSIGQHTMHTLHIAHEVFACLTFFILAMFMFKCASIVSAAAFRELKARFGKPEDRPLIEERFTLKSGEVVPVRSVLTSDLATINDYPLSGRKTPVEKRGGDILARGVINVGGEITITPRDDITMYDNLKNGTALYNYYSGRLALSGIWIKSEKDLTRLGSKIISNIYVLGGIEYREGTDKVVEFVNKHNIKITDDEFAPKVALCNYDEFNETLIENPDIAAIITHNKITHLLKIIYYARMYQKQKRLMWVYYLASLIIICVGFSVFEELMGYDINWWMFAFLGATVRAAVDLIQIRMIEKHEGKLTFEKIDNI